ncbi:hypothetical protein RFI_03772, partial [Reticulomyxa filosa]
MYVQYCNILLCVCVCVCDEQVTDNTTKANVDNETSSLIQGGRGRRPSIGQYPVSMCFCFFFSSPSTSTSDDGHSQKRNSMDCNDHKEDKKHSRHNKHNEKDDEENVECMHMGLWPEFVGKVGLLANAMISLLLFVNSLDPQWFVVQILCILSVFLGIMAITASVIYEFSQSYLESMSTIARRRVGNNRTRQSLSGQQQQQQQQPPNVRSSLSAVVFDPTTNIGKKRSISEDQKKEEHRIIAHYSDSESNEPDIPIRPHRSRRQRLTH